MVELSHIPSSISKEMSTGFLTGMGKQSGGMKEASGLQQPWSGGKVTPTVEYFSYREMDSGKLESTLGGKFSEKQFPRENVRKRLLCHHITKLTAGLGQEHRLPHQFLWGFAWEGGLLLFLVCCACEGIRFMRARA